MIADHDLDFDLRREYRSLEAVRAENNSANYGNAVSHPFPRDFSLNQGSSASNNGDGEEMTEEEFFAQFGEEVPEWAKDPPITEQQAQDIGFPDLLEADLEAQLDSELGAATANGPMDTFEEDLEAQLDAELAAGNMDICQQDLEAQLNAELEAETRQEEAAESARRKANLEEELRIAAEKAALAAPCSLREDPPSPTEEVLQAEPTAYDATDGLLGDIFDKFEEMSHLGNNVNAIAVKRYSYRRPNKRAKKSKTPEVRVPRSQPPPMRKADELPQMYHHGEIDWELLKKHMSLST